MTVELPEEGLVAIPRWLVVAAMTFLLCLCGHRRVLAQTSQHVPVDTVTIEWVVRVPEKTPPDATLYIIGSAAELGAWQPPGSPLARRSDGRFTARVKLPRGLTVEYKVTKGSWDGVEKGPNGEEIANRTFRADKDSTVDIEVASWAGGSASSPAGRPAVVSRRTGTVHAHERFDSKSLSNQRTIWVWLPPGYEKDKNQRYPVLYMHDGQNLFDSATAFIGIEWGVDETAEQLVRAGRIPPIIVVGIANTPDRMSEYTPWPDKTRPSGGRGDLYARFLLDEVKPFVDKTYRTKPDRANTAVAGSSLGGLISLHLAMTHPEVFSKCAAVSPALMWADGRILKDIEAEPDRLKGVRLWFDMGTREGRQIETFGSAVKWTQRLAKTLDANGLKAGLEYQYLEVEGGEHNEASWAARLDQILIFLFDSERGASTRPSN